jgi:hypothetical protein
MLFFAHHMAVELFGREFSPHTVFEHVCVFAVVAFVLGTSAYGTWTLVHKVREKTRLARWF